MALIKSLILCNRPIQHLRATSCSKFCSTVSNAGIDEPVNLRERYKILKERIEGKLPTIGK